MGLSMKLIRADILAAEKMISVYETDKSSDIKVIIAFHIQQACEKLIKIQIYKNGGNENDSKYHTHNIERLIRFAESSGIDIIVPKYVREKYGDITLWEASGRYDEDFSVRIDTLTKAYSVIYDWYNDLKSSGLR